MARICDIDGFITSVAKREYSESWDNDGVMLCGDIQKDVKKVLVCLEINEKVALFAKKCGFELIVTHHPFIFKPLSRICGNDYKLIETLITSGISVLSYHTRYDAACGGINDTLAKTLCLFDIKPLGEGYCPMGRYGVLESEMTYLEFAGHLKQKLCCPDMRCFISDKNKKIKTVAVLGGGGKDFVYDASKIADAYVTGDLSHNAFIDAKTYGISVFEAGHYHTENIGAYALCDMLKEKFADIYLETFDCESPFEVI